MHAYGEASDFNKLFEVSISSFEGTAYVVNGPLIPVQKATTACTIQHRWILMEMAAQAMKRCVENPNETTRMAHVAGIYRKKTHRTFQSVIECLAQRKVIDNENQHSCTRYTQVMP